MGIWIVAICLLVTCNLEDPGAQEKEVRISVDRDAYASGDTVVVTIDNALDSLITTVDHQSFCWIARLQIAGPEAWKDAGECFSLMPAQELGIEPAGSRILLVPVRTGTDVYPALVHPGRYRWQFVYSTDKGFSFSRAQYAFSRAFTVQ